MRLDAPHVLQMVGFQAVTTNGGDAIDALCFQLHDSYGEYWQAVRLWRIREVKKFFRQVSSLEDLSDDFVSALYDPSGTSSARAIFSLANVLQPRLGIFQLFGVRGCGRSMEEALDASDPVYYALKNVFEGKFRQSIVEPLATDDAVAWYRHLSDCSHLGVLLGHPVPRMMGTARMDDSNARLQAEESAEQMEVVAAACAEIPFILNFFVDPLKFSQINTMLRDTLRELGKLKSEAQGSQNASISMVLPAFATPHMSYEQTAERQAGTGHSAALQHVQQLADLTRFHAEQQNNAYTGAHDQADIHRGVDHILDTESRYTSLAGHERVQEHGVQRMLSDKLMTDDWQLSKDYAGAEQGVIAEKSIKAVATVGQRAELSQTQDHTQSFEQRHTDDKYSGQEKIHQLNNYSFAEQGFRNTQYNFGEVGNKNSNYSFGERTNIGGQITTGIGSTDNHTYTDSNGFKASSQGVTNHNDSGKTTSDGGSFKFGGQGSTFNNTDQTKVTKDDALGTKINLGVEGSLAPKVYGIGGGAKADGTLYSNTGESQKDSSNTGTTFSSFSNDQKEGNHANVTNNGTSSQSAAQQGVQSKNGTSSDVRAFNETKNISGFETRSGGGSRSENYATRGSGFRNETYQTGGTGWREDNISKEWTGRQVHDMSINSDIVTQAERAVKSQYGESYVQKAASVTAYSKAFKGTYDETGTRSDHITSDEVSEWQNDVSRNFAREQNQFTKGDGWRMNDGAAQQSLAEAGSQASDTRNISHDHVSGPSTNSDDSSDARLYQGTSRVITSGFGAGGAPSLVAGMGYSRATYDEQKAALAVLLMKQQGRLEKGLTTGLFSAHSYIGAKSAADLDALSRALVSTLREDNVIQPIQVRAFDAATSARLLKHQTCLTPCHDPEYDHPLEREAFATLLTSDELGAVVHPLRIDGSGGISTTVDAIPSGLATPAALRGEMWWGDVVSPTHGRKTDTEYRVGAEALMHLTLVGGSGSGKSNTAQHILGEVFNIRMDAGSGLRIPTPTLQFGELRIPHPVGKDAGIPAIGATVFDPTGEWRRMGLLLSNPAEFRFYSLTDPNFSPLRVNPLRVPSPYISPNAWAEMVAKRWALAYATGSTGYYAIKKAILSLYQSVGVIDPKTGATNWQASASLSMADLYDTLNETRGDKAKERSKQDISLGVIDRILEKMSDYLRDSGSTAYFMFGQPGGCVADDFMAEHVLTVLEGRFEDDGMKVFLMGLLGAAAFAHAEGRWEARGRNTKNTPQHILVFEEAHEVMEGDDKKSEAAGAVEKGTSLFNKMFDQGRKYGLYVWGIGQRLKALPEGLLSSSRILIVQAVDEAEDIKLAVTKLGFLTSGMLEDVTWMKFLQNMEQGRGVVRFTRMAPTESGRKPDLMRPVLLQFPPVMVDVPTDEMLRTILIRGGQI